MNQAHPAAGIITSVERQKKSKNRYNMFVDGHYSFSVHEDVMIKHRLIKGEAVELQLISRILEEDEGYRAYLDAVRHIGRRPRAVLEVKLYLKNKGYMDQLIEATIEKLHNEQLLNDEAFSRIWMEQRINYQRKGRKLIEMELLHKGVDRSIISKVMAAVDAEDEYTAASQIASKKWKVTKGDLAAKRQKLIMYLLQRGYSSEVINRVLNNMDINGIDYE